MNTFILDDHDRVTIARRPITVTASVTGGHDGDVRLAALSGGSPARDAYTPRAGVLVVPRVDGRTLVRVEPGHDRELFPEGAIVSVTLSTDRSRESDGDVVIVRDVEMSGPSRELVAIDVVDDQRLAVAALGHTSDPLIGALPSRARAAARARLGDDRTAEAVNLLVAIDMSASVAPAIADGSLRAAIDIVAGLSHVVDPDRPVDVVLLADRSIRLPQAPSAELAARTLVAIAEHGLGCGFRSSPADLHIAPETVTYVVTDGVPADVTALRTAQRPQDVRHLVLIGGAGPAAVDPVLRATWFPPPPQGVDASAHLLAMPGELSKLVASMLRPFETVQREGVR